ncbi:YdeI family protein [Chloroflexota bacterium]
MDIRKTLHVNNRKHWHEWLESNFGSEKEIWLVYPSKQSGKPRISYNDAVEEALSFGWIDSTVKRVDQHATAQRFSPRKPNSEYSQANKERLKWLLKKGKIHNSIRKSIEKALRTEFVFPHDIIKAIQENKKAWDNYQHFSSAYKRIRIAYINAARNRPEEFRKRLNNFIKKAEGNKLVGFGGIEKYY